MNKVIASVSLLALGAAGLQTAQGQLTAGSSKPWTIAGTLRGFYDDNIYTAPSGPDRLDSFGYEIRPSASVMFSDGPTTFTGSYLYSFRDYLDHRQGRRYDQAHDAEVDLNHAFNERFRVEVQDSFVISQEPDIISGTSASAFPLRTDLSNLRNTGAVTLNGQLTERLSFLLGYSITLYDYTQNQGNLPTGDLVPSALTGALIPGTASLSAELDRLEHLVTLEAHWKAFEQTTALLGYQFGAVDFTSNESLNPVVPVPLLGGIAYFPTPFGPVQSYKPSVRDDYSHYVYAGLQHAFRSDLTVSVKGGIQYVDYYNASAVPGSPTSSLSPFADVSLNYTYMEGAIAVLGFRHAHNATDQAITYNGGVPALTLDQESSTVYLSLVQKLSFLSPRLTATLSGQYQNAQWNGGAGSLNNVNEDIYAAGANLAYQFNHYISSELGYNFDYLSAGQNVYGGGYHRNRVYAGITASF